MVQKMVQSIILPYAVNQQVRKWGQVDGKCSQRSIRNLELLFCTRGFQTQTFHWR